MASNKAKTITLTCDGCGTTFERSAAKVRASLKWGNKTFYCGNSCQRSRRKIPWQQEILDMTKES